MKSYVLELLMVEDEVKICFRLIWKVKAIARDYGISYDVLSIAYTATMLLHFHCAFATESTSYIAFEHCLVLVTDGMIKISSCLWPIAVQCYSWRLSRFCNGLV